MAVAGMAEFVHVTAKAVAGSTEACPCPCPRRAMFVALMVAAVEVMAATAEVDAAEAEVVSLMPESVAVVLTKARP